MISSTHIRSTPSQTDVTQIDSQLWSQFIYTCDQQCDAKRPTHHRLFVMHTLPEPERKITHRLRDALNLDPLVVREIVVLGGDARVVDHGACVGGEAGHGASEVAVDFHDFFDGAGFKEGGLDAFLDCEDDAFGGADTDGGRTELRGREVRMKVIGEGVVLTLIASMAYSTGWVERGWVRSWRAIGCAYLGIIGLLERRCLHHDLERP